MTMLETTIINFAEELLAEVMLYCCFVKERLVTDDDQRDYYQALGALSGLLALAHKSDCGMSADATRSLLKIEDQVAAASPEIRNFSG